MTTPSSPEPDPDSVFGPPGPVDFGGAMPDDESLFEHLPEPAEPAPQERPPLKRSGICARPASKAPLFIKWLAWGGPMTYPGLARATRLNPDPEMQMSRSGVGNRGPALEAAGLIQNVSPEPGGRSLWAATEAGVRAAGLEHSLPLLDSPSHVLAAACTADWILQHAENLTPGEHLIPRSKIAPLLEGAPYELAVQLDRLSAITLAYPYRPAFVITHTPAAPNGGPTTGYELLTEEPEAGWLEMVLRRYAASGWCDHVVLGSHLQEILDHVVTVSDSLGWADRVSVKVYQPSPECRWVLGPED